MVDIPDVVTDTNFGDHRLRGFWVAGGQISPSPIDFHRRPYNTLALPCERVSGSSYEIVISQSMNSLIHIQHDYTACVNNVDFRLLVASIRLNGWRRGVVVSRVRRLN